MTNEVAIYGSSVVGMPLMSIQDAAIRRQALVDFTSTIMQRDVDYGKIPGVNKDTLLKPGAEKLTTFFGLSPYFEVIESDTDWTGEGHGGEPFFYFFYRCTLRQGEIVAGVGDGSCNTWEKKYRYRRAGIKCPHCGQEAIIKGRQEYGGGWLCYAKKGGCGSKWVDGAPEIEGQEVGQVKNENPADLVNTVQKMAQKRALVAATLIAVNASEFFTQDVEDYRDFIEGDFTEAPQPSTRPKQTQQKAANGNGGKFSKRPYQPEVLKEAMQLKTKDDSGEMPNKKQAQWAAASLSVITLDDAERYALTSFLFGVDSTKKLTAKQAGVITDWVKYNKIDDEWVFNEDARQEAALVIAELNKRDEEDAVGNEQQEPLFEGQA